MKGQSSRWSLGGNRLKQRLAHKAGIGKRCHYLADKHAELSRAATHIIRALRGIALLSGLAEA
jgi:hypothetical protein